MAAEPKSILKSAKATPEPDESPESSLSATSSEADEEPEEDEDEDAGKPESPLPDSLVKVPSDPNIANYFAKSTIGYGNSAQVLKAVNKKDSQVYALKRLRGVKRAPEKGRKMIVSEVKMMSKVAEHPYIVNLKEAIYDEGGDDAYIAMEYVEGGTLKDLIKKGPLPEAKLLYYMVQICLAVKHLHENNICHRDLKTENIYLTADDRVKVGDFGIARELEPLNFSKTLAGTPHYMSPEAISGKTYTTKTDMWSLGVIIYEMATGGRLPFPATHSMEALISQLGHQRHPRLPAGYSRGVTDIYDALLQKNPESRPTINEVLQHPTMYAAFEALPHKETKGLMSKRGTMRPRREAFMGRLRGERSAWQMQEKWMAPPGSAAAAAAKQAAPRHATAAAAAPHTSAAPVKSSPVPVRRGAASAAAAATAATSAAAPSSRVVSHAGAPAAAATSSRATSYTTAAASSATPGVVYSSSTAANPSSVVYSSAPSGSGAPTSYVYSSSAASRPASSAVYTTSRGVSGGGGGGGGSASTAYRVVSGSYATTATGSAGAAPYTSSYVTSAAPQYYTSSSASRHTGDYYSSAAAAPSYGGSSAYSSAYRYY